MSRRRIALIAFSAVLIVALTIALALGRRASDHVFFQTLPQDRPLVHAHRGGAQLWPENTLVAFAGAVDIGADVLEMDVFSTADGVPVVIHDTTVDRTTDGAGPVNSFTLSRLRELDAGYRFRPIAGAPTADSADEFPYRGQGIRVPTLREVFEAFPAEHMIVEVKENNARLADAMIALVREFGRENRTLIGSFHHDILEHVRATAPEIATHGSERELIPFLVASWLLMGGAMSPGYEAVLVPQRSGPIPVTTRRFIRAAQRRNLHVAAWTINDPDQMRELVRRGIDGLITDRPDLAIE
ncbi:MAG: glycerophosphodiester phosphodiesterase, partial [Spirochaetaceae bacterium]